MTPKHSIASQHSEPRGMESCHTRVAIAVIVSTLGHHASAYCSGSWFKSLMHNVMVRLVILDTVRLVILDTCSRSDVDAEHMIQMNNVWCDFFTVYRFVSITRTLITQVPLQLGQFSGVGTVLVDCHVSR